MATHDRSSPDAGREFSWGPESRARPTREALVLAALGVAVVILLVAGVVGAVVDNSGSGSPATPSHFRRLADRADHLSVAVPDSWQVPALRAGTLSSQIQDLTAQNPKMAPLANVLRAVLATDQVQVFAVDTGTQTSFFSYGADDPQVTSVDQISASTIVSRLQAAGATDIQVTNVHLPIGTAKQVSDQLTVGAVTISEVVDYLPRAGRLVAIVLVASGNPLPNSLLRQIQGTLASA